MATRSTNLKHRDPQKHQRIAEMLKEGMPLRAIAAVEEVSHSTVQMVKYDVLKDLPNFKAKLANKYAGTLEKIANRLDNQADKLQGKDIAVSLGILQDKFALLADQPTSISRVEQVQLPDPNDVLASLKAAKVSNVIDVTPSEPVPIELSNALAKRCASDPAAPQGVPQGNTSGSHLGGRGSNAGDAANGDESEPKKNFS